MGREKAPDEVFCTACGARIKAAAELCPECGVRNRPAGAAGTGARASSSPGRSGAGAGTGAESRESRGETTVSDSWWYGVALCLGLWVVLLVVGSADIAPGGDAVAGLLLLGAWIGLPVSAYYDMKYVRHHSDWQPNSVLWVIGLLVWLLNVVLGLVYLYRRHETLGKP